MSLPPRSAHRPRPSSASSAFRPACARRTRAAAARSPRGSRSASRSPRRRRRCISRTSPNARVPYSAAIFAARSLLMSTTPASETPGSDARIRAWCCPRCPTPITAALISSRFRRGCDAPAAPRPRCPLRSPTLRNASRSKISVLPASTDSTFAPASRIAWIVASPTTGTSKRMSWFGLATLMMRDAVAGEVAGARDGFVGAFHGLDRDHRLMLHGDGLADIEAGNGIGHAIAELEILALRLVRRAIAQLSLAREQRLEKRRRVEQLDAALAHQVGDRADQRVGVEPLQLAHHRQRRQVGHEAAEDLGVLDLPGHHRLRDLVVFEDLQAGRRAGRATPSARRPSAAWPPRLRSRSMLLL